MATDRAASDGRAGSLTEGPPRGREPLRALVLRHVSKRFGGTQALDGVHLTVAAAEVHVLLGENGSGKSTLIKLLSGFHEPDAFSEFRVYGEALPLPTSPAIMRLHGTGFVHQELGLIPVLSVTENVFLTSIAEGTFGACRWRRMADRTRELLDRLEIAISPVALVKDLGQGDRALVAIARALMELEMSIGAQSSTRRGLLVLDEPTAFLDASETERLWRLLRRLRAEGNSVLMVLHDLKEALAIADQLTILRDGRVVGTIAAAQASISELTRLILGSAQPEPESRSNICTGGEGQRANAAAATTPDTRETVHVQVTLGPSGGSLELGGGEVVGLTGLRGGAWEQLPYRLFGAGEPLSGTLALDGRAIPLATLEPHLSVALGLALIPSDRLGAGCYENLSLAENLISLRLPDVTRGPIVSARLAKGIVSEQLRQFNIRPRQPSLDLGLFSGGNQQKTVLARWLQLAPRVLLLHEPTQGVDVGARVQVHAAIRGAAGSGAAVLLASSDHGELADVCDRVLVMRRNGKLVEIPHPSLTPDAITQACLSGDLSGPTSADAAGRELPE